MRSSTTPLASAATMLVPWRRSLWNDDVVCAGWPLPHRAADGSLVHDIQPVAVREPAALFRMAKAAVLIIHLEVIHRERLVRRHGNDCFPAVPDAHRRTHRIKLSAN